MSTQLARFKIATRPARSPFTIFIESASGGDKENIAPGMYVKLFVHFKCDNLSEPEEQLVLDVQNGSQLTITMRARRDPPILKGSNNIVKSPVRIYTTFSFFL